jgi:hypothetical protein
MNPGIRSHRLKSRKITTKLNPMKDKIPAGELQQIAQDIYQRGGSSALIALSIAALDRWHQAKDAEAAAQPQTEAEQK